MAFFDPKLVEVLNSAAIAAGAEILRIRDRGHDVREKEDSSPVTDADEAGERIILEALEAATPDIPIVAEEKAAAGCMPDDGRLAVLARRSAGRHQGVHPRPRGFHRQYRA